MDQFRNIPSNGKIAMRFDEDATDRLVGVVLLTGQDDVLLAAQHKGMRFNAEEVREFQGRTSTGIRGMDLASGDNVFSLSMLSRFDCTTDEREAYLKSAKWKADPAAPTLSPERMAEFEAAEEFIFVVTANGYGKRFSSHELPAKGRGGKGVAITDVQDHIFRRTGPVVACFPVQERDQIMLVTDQAKLIRFGLDDINIKGRAAQGVHLFDVAPGEHVVSAARIDEEEEPENEAEAMVAEELGEAPPAAASDSVRLDDGTGPDTLPDSQEEGDA